MVDAHVLGACGAIHGGSSPLPGTLLQETIFAMLNVSIKIVYAKKNQKSCSQKLSLRLNLVYTVCWEFSCF